MVWLSAPSFKSIRGKHVQVPFVLSGAAKVTLTVLRGKKLVAKLSTVLSKAGRGRITWNGKIKRTLAPRGVYKLVVIAVSPAGASARDAGTVRIT
jgi:hypothetical protein